ncbi:hypothetical protein PHAVU_009G262400 [Phaseolus vulgaris]|uniref:J domain-containing protein n=1 Tax=Phaseolus vulgaris TaxID=3885 RepID=V7AZQ9_PHAVU|nr:hypothetical protein PHAVU_009G262400g [Phaseolus vulgaris]ESW11064.1 hypothetical protein PHAVU_009G262400g [Phaseolus vulgaris]
MAKGGEKCSEELYEVLGIEKECTPSELKNAYKKLALIVVQGAAWKKARRSSRQSSTRILVVLSDVNTRLLYDVGVYDSDDDQTVSTLILPPLLFSSTN